MSRSQRRSNTDRKKNDDEAATPLPDIDDPILLPTGQPLRQQPLFGPGGGEEDQKDPAKWPVVRVRDAIIGLILSAAAAPPSSPSSSSSHDPSSAATAALARARQARLAAQIGGLSGGTRIGRKTLREVRDLVMAVPDGHPLANVMYQGYCLNWLQDRIDSGDGGSYVRGLAEEEDDDE